MEPFDSSVQAAIETGQFLNPDGSSFFLKVEDSWQRLVVGPAGLPLGLVACWLAVVPFGVTLWFVSSNALRQGFEKDLGLVFVVCTPFAAAGMLGFVWLLNRHSCAKRDYLVLDKQDKTLTLPRLGKVFKEEQIVGFSEVHNWHITREGWSSDTSWLCELSVVARDPLGRQERFSVVVNNASKPVTWLDDQLAEFFHVPRLVYRRGWFGKSRSVILLAARNGAFQDERRGSSPPCDPHRRDQPGGSSAMSHF